MKKLLASVATLALAFTLASPAFAKKTKKNAKAETATTKQSTSKGKMHLFHAKKKGATKGKKKGQQGTNPGL
jgi:hypothetical protein